jgi:hypothetical protein
MPENVQKQLKNELHKLDETIEESKRLQQIVSEEGKPIYTVYSWKAPERIFEPKSKNWYVSLGTVAMVIIVISALTANFGLIFAIIALILFIYALNTIPPKMVTYEITNKGMKVHNSLFTWRNILGFWVLERGKHVIINMEVHTRFNSLNYERVMLLKGEGDINKIVTYLVQHLDYLSSREVPTNIIARYTQGAYQPLVKYLLDNGIMTKDPNDTPVQETSKPAAAQA